VERTGVAFSSGGTPRDMVACVQTAEAAGFESCWLAESCADTMSLLGACALATSTIKLGSGIQGVFSRSPVSIALAAMTVDSLSGGRYRLGLGIGHREEHDRRNDIERERPLPFENRALRLRESAEAIRAVVAATKAGEPTDYDGEIFGVRQYRPAPTWEPHREAIPIYFAAVSEGTMQLVGQIADGVLPIFVPLDRVPELTAQIASSARAAGRDPAEIDLACWIPVVVSDDRATALEACRREVFAHLAVRFYRNHFRRLGYGEIVERNWRKVAAGDFTFDEPATSEELDALGAFAGTAEECAERVAAYRKAGVTLPILYLPVRTQVGGDALIRRQMTALGPVLR
jgi:alkanesulfonate monooxygenase SsuD/methylene tetrahydromethanopterin reductase-like flavin-dependent oxidoreductase (luciferase family)